MSIRVLYHDNCLDGAVSAALFTAFYKSCINKNTNFEYVGVNHGPGDVFAGGTFRTEAEWEHACVDFRYSPSPRLNWWFDHHRSAFLTKEDEAHFYEVMHPQHFYDPAARSCSKFLSEKCKEVYGFDTKPYEDLIYWTDIVDGAQFESPKMAVELKEPALKLMTWVEANHRLDLKTRFIQDLQTRSLEQIVGSDYIQQALVPLLRDHEQNLFLMKSHIYEEKEVVVYDITNQKMRAPNKFIPYYLYPTCHYVVGISKSPGRIKISVGSNPWYSSRRTVNIADICARYGGGGHPVVGAVSLPESQMGYARQIMKEIITELQAAVKNEQ